MALRVDGNIINAGMFDRGKQRLKPARMFIHDGKLMHRHSGLTPRFCRASAVLRQLPLCCLF
jgi:hypothetical protein